MATKKIQDQMNKLYSEDEAYWLGVVTPTEIGRLLEGMEKGIIASKAACAEMIRALRAQQSGAPVSRITSAFRFATRPATSRPSSPTTSA
jgi:hypothetical protein